MFIAPKKSIQRHDSLESLKQLVNIVFPTVFQHHVLQLTTWITLGSTCCALLKNKVKHSALEDTNADGGSRNKKWHESCEVL